MVIYLQKVIINPVYGGIESGVVSGNIIEKDFNLEIKGTNLIVKAMEAREILIKGKIFEVKFN